MKKKFKEIIGNASTSAWRKGRFVGHNCNAVAYSMPDELISVEMESNGSSAKGFKRFIWTEKQYEEWKESCPEGLHMMLHGLRLFNCTTAFDEEESFS